MICFKYVLKQRYKNWHVLCWLLRYEQLSKRYKQQQQQLRAFIVSEDHMKQAFSLLKALNS
ncbi:hypothetical protein [Serratia proteamaculans]|uniref:hypothetical protein n=1 Tax=Serratia proteamaculans TaxID=28151 RepID=UPI0039B0C611